MPDWGPGGGVHRARECWRGMGCGEGVCACVCTHACACIPASYQDLYDSVASNPAGMREEFALFWGTAAAAFKGVNSVIGIEMVCCRGVVNAVVVVGAGLLQATE